MPSTATHGDLVHGAFSLWALNLPPPINKSAEDGGEWVSIMVWGGACYHLLRRDEYIGWTPTLCAQRLKLIASNRRFTILAKPSSKTSLMFAPNITDPCPKQ